MILNSRFYEHALVNLSWVILW